MSQDSLDNNSVPDEVYNKRREQYEDVVFALAMKQVNGIPAVHDDTYNYLEADFALGFDGNPRVTSIYELMYAREQRILTPLLRAVLLKKIEVLEYYNSEDENWLEYYKAAPDVARLFNTTVLNPTLNDVLINVLDDTIEKRKYHPLAAKTLAQAMALFED
jgi:hypothetical protein